MSKDSMAMDTYFPQSFHLSYRIARGSMESSGVRGVRDFTLTFLHCIVNINLLARSIKLKSPHLDRIIRESPQTFGFVRWPYICASWGVRQRFESLWGHCTILDSSPGFIAAGPRPLKFLDLEDYVPRMSIVIDRPHWFLREGELALSIFIGDERLYSIAFCLGNDFEGGFAIVGCIQGRSIPGVRDVYKSLTKSLFGIRPRDLLIIILEIICEYFGARKIIFVSETARIHNHPYFGGKSFDASNYDDIWRDRGAVQVGKDFFELRGRSYEVDISEVPSAKRAMYRRRSEFICILRERIEKTFRVYTRNNQNLSDSRGI